GVSRQHLEYGSVEPTVGGRIGYGRISGNQCRAKPQVGARVEVPGGHDLPSAQYRVHGTGRTGEEMTAFSKRKLIGSRDGHPVMGVRAVQQGQSIEVIIERVQEE